MTGFHGSKASPVGRWHPHGEQWEKGFEHLEAFAATMGHARVAAKFRSEDGYRLGQWVVNQRANKMSLNDQRVSRLEALNGWVWRAR